MTHLSRRHAPAFLYLLGLVWLLTSSVAAYAQDNGGRINVLIIAGLVAGTAALYAVLWHTVGARLLERFIFINNTSDHEETRWWTTPSLIVLTCAYLFVIVSHYYLIRSFPLVESLQADTDIGISVARQEGYFGLPLWARYASDISIKAIGPSLLVLTAYFRSRLFWLALVAGITYTTLLFAKSLPLWLLLPLLIFYLSTGRIVRSALVTCLIVTLLVGLTTLASVKIRTTSAPTSVALSDPTTASKTASAPTRNVPSGLPVPDQRKNRSGIEAAPELPPEPPHSWKESSSLYALYERAFLIPGRVIEKWFAYYRLHPKENGCAYQRLAPLLGCDFADPPTKLYKYYYPENVAAGMLGSLNAAFFMVEWSNFGIIGIAFSAALGAALFTFVAVIYGAHPLALPMNAILIFTLLETGFFTALASGSGWLVSTGIFIFFFRRLRHT